MHSSATFSPARLIAYNWLLLLLIARAAHGQHFFVNTRQVPLRRAIEVERQLHSLPRQFQRVITPSDFRLGSGPACFTRTNAGIWPRPVVAYYFSVPDSVVRQIAIEVDSANFLRYIGTARQDYREPLTRLPLFERTYEQLRQELVALLGSPQRSQALTLEQADADRASYSQSDLWETDSLTAYMYLSFTKTAAPPYGYAHRIRAYLTYKNRAAAATNAPGSFEANAGQTETGQRYVSLLMTGKFKESWELVGPSIKNTMTYTQYAATMTPFVKKMSGRPTIALVMSGPMINELGQSLSAYMYRVMGSKATEPPLLFNILFQDANATLIGGVQPRIISAPVLIQK